MFIWMVKSLKLIVNKCFCGFRRLHVRTVKVSNKHQKWDQNPSQNRWTIDTNFMIEKWIPKTWKLINKVIKKVVGNEKQLEKKHAPKRHEKRRIAQSLPTSACGARGHYKIKDRVKTDRRKTKRGKARQMLTRPGRLRARSGYIGPKGLPGFLGKGVNFHGTSSGSPSRNQQNRIFEAIFVFLFF